MLHASCFLLDIASGCCSWHGLDAKGHPDGGVFGVCFLAVSLIILEA